MGLLFLCLLSLTIYSRSRHRLRENIRKHLRDIVAVSALQIDGSIHNTLTNKTQEGSAAYRQIQESIQVPLYAIDNIEAVYTVRKDTEGNIIFVVDAETNSAVTAHLGEVYSDAGPLLTDIFDKIDKPMVEKEFYTDKYGTWLSGYAPFYDDKGKPAGLIGVDIDAAELATEQNKTLLTSIILLGASLPFMFVAVLLTSRKLSALAMRIENKLRRKHQQLELVMEGAEIGWWDWNIKDHSEVYNNILPKLLGYPDSEIRLHDCCTQNCIHHDDIEIQKNALQKHLVQKTEFYICTYRLKTADGKWTWFTDHGKVIKRDNNGRPLRMLGTLRNVNEQQTAAENLKDSEERYRLLADNTVDIIWVMDPHLSFTYISPAVSEILGYKVDDIIGENLNKFVTPETFSYIKQLFREKIARGPDDVPKLVEFEILNSEGKSVSVESKGRFLFNKQGQPTAMQGIMRDITKRKNSEAEKERLLFAIEQATETIIITDTNAITQYVNPAFLQLSGYSEEEIINHNPRILKSGKHNDAFYKNMWEIITSGKTWTGRVTNKRKDGTLYTEDASISPVRNAAGDIVNYVSVRRNVTQEIKLEKQLHQAQKMESVGLLAGGIAHDFNNILQAINGYADLALDDLTPQDKAFDSIKRISDAGSKAAALVRQILAFSRRQVLDMKSLNINDVIEKLTNSMLRTLGAHINIDFEADNTLDTVQADPVQIEQIIMNLCLNARDAMPNGGTITIETGNVMIDEDYCETHTWVIHPGPYVMLCITDTGCGMDKNTLENIFDPFFTTKDVGEGTGLGLSTVYGLVKQHGGMVDVYSEVDMGTTFKIYIPQSEQCEKSQTKKNDGPAKGGTETILLAEDDEGVFKIAKTFLELAGYKVLGARDGVEAIDIFDKHEHEIDMALLDVMMPRKGGRAVYEHIHKKQENFKVLFASGYSMNAIHTHFVLDEGMNLIPKPYQRNDLLREIRAVLDSQPTPAST